MRVLIVGCGYVGLPLGAELVRLGHQVFGLRRSVANAELQRGGGMDEYRQLYLQGMRNLIDWLGPSAQRTNVEIPRIVYTSSTGVYGQNDGSRVDEASVTEPAT